MIIQKAMATRVQPDRVMPAFRFTSHAVNGHAEIPEKSANQPFVSGSGPCVMMSPKPPITATIVHAQAASHAKTRANKAGIERSQLIARRNSNIGKKVKVRGGIKFDAFNPLAINADVITNRQRTTMCAW